MVAVLRIPAYPAGKPLNEVKVEDPAAVGGAGGVRDDWADDFSLPHTGEVR